MTGVVVVVLVVVSPRGGCGGGGRRLFVLPRMYTYSTSVQYIGISFLCTHRQQLLEQLQLRGTGVYLLQMFSRHHIKRRCKCMSQRRYAVTDMNNSSKHTHHVSCTSQVMSDLCRRSMVAARLTRASKHSR